MDKFLQIHGRIQSFIKDFDTTLLTSRHQTTLVTYTFTDSRAPETPKCGSGYINRSEKILAPVFPQVTRTHDLVCDAVSITPFQTLFIGVISPNKDDADLILTQVMGVAYTCF